MGWQAEANPIPVAAQVDVTRMRRAAVSVIVIANGFPLVLKGQQRTEMIGFPTGGEAARHRRPFIGRLHRHGPGVSTRKPALRMGNDTRDGRF